MRVFRIENRILKKTSIRNKKKSKCDCALTETRPDINSNPESPALKQSTQQNKENSKKSCDLGNFSLNKTENVKANDVNDITSGINKMLNIPVLNTALTTEKKQNDLNLIKLGNSISNSNANGYGYSNYSHSQRNDLNTKLTNSIPLQNMKMNQIQKYLNSVSSVYPMNTNANHANTNVNSNIYGNSLSILSIQEYLQRIRLNMNYIQDCFKEIDHNSAIIRNINFLINKIKTQNMY